MHIPTALQVIPASEFANKAPSAIVFTRSTVQSLSQSDPEQSGPVPSPLSGPDPLPSGPDPPLSGPDPPLSGPDPPLSGPDPLPSGPDPPLSGPDPLPSGPDPPPFGPDPPPLGPDPSPFGPSGQFARIPTVYGDPPQFEQPLGPVPPPLGLPGLEGGDGNEGIGKEQFEACSVINGTFALISSHPVSYTHLTLPTIYSV